MLASTTAAERSGARSPYSPLSMAMARATVRLVPSRRMSREKGSSFHMDWTPMMTRVPTMGLATGAMIRVSMLKVEAPSMRADSTSSKGTLAK